MVEIGKVSKQFVRDFLRFNLLIFTDLCLYHRRSFALLSLSGFGSDEYLNAEASYLSVKHAQEKGVVTCAKHYIAYEVS